MFNNEHLGQGRLIWVWSWNGSILCMKGQSLLSDMCRTATEVKVPGCLKLGL